MRFRRRRACVVCYAAAAPQWKHISICSDEQRAQVSERERQLADLRAKFGELQVPACTAAGLVASVPVHGQSCQCTPALFTSALASSAAALPRGSPLCQLLPCGPSGCRLLSGSTSRC